MTAQATQMDSQAERRQLDTSVCVPRDGACVWVSGRLRADARAWVSGRLRAARWHTCVGFRDGHVSRWGPLQTGVGGCRGAAAVS